MFERIYLAIILAIGCCHSKSFPGPFQDPGQPLYLSPLIQSGQIEYARELALVNAFNPVISYSGLITVSEEFGSNTFFWYFPAESSYSQDDPSIPLLLWQDGGPGYSCMVTIFDGNGPFLAKKIDEEHFNISHNPISYHKKYHIIYMDNPVDVGFSHTMDEKGHVHTTEQASQDIYTFLQQFFQLFPNLKSNPFYNIGVSYGGKYTTETAYRIHNGNLNETNSFINLTGVIQDSPLIDNYGQIRYAQVFFGAGLINQEQLEESLVIEEAIQNFIKAQEYAEAYALYANYSFGKIYEMTGYFAHYHLTEGDNPSRSQLTNVTPFINLTSTRVALHVGNLPFKFYNSDQQARMAVDMMSSSAWKLDEILKAGYRYQLIIGNMDVLTGLHGLRKVFESLEWDGRNEFFDGNRTIWRENESIKGYLGQSGNAELVLMRNAGHSCLFDHPDWVLEAVEKFLGS